MALGGHVSKAHPYGSETYNKKLEIRERREVERECLKEAKTIVQADNFGSIPSYM